MMQPPVDEMKKRVPNLLWGKKHRHITSFQVIFLGFLLVILTGALLLMLPIASQAGRVTPFSDALFTATSAVCVTGLVVVDTAAYWSLFGQIVILLLIQIGGMGVVTLAVVVVTISGRKIGLMQRSAMQEAIAAHQIGGIVRLTGFIMRTILFLEGLGALCLSTVFVPEFGLTQGVWYSVFHSISAFCNAGFDLMGVKQTFSSLTDYAANPVVNLTIMLLIVVGGIGFLTWDDVRVNRLNLQRYRMQSKIILTVTTILILGAAAYFFFFEFQALPLKERLLCAFFQSVTPRTAGFNTVDLNGLSEVGQMLLILLMLIGGSPGSTAGGMKTTTLAVVLATALAVFRQEDEGHIYSRRIPVEAVKNAVTILMMYLVLFMTGGMIISTVEGVPLMAALLETGSAIGTVGLSLGITPGLGQISRAVLVFLMFFGRVGGLTIVFAAVTDRRIGGSKYPQGKITVG